MAVGSQLIVGSVSRIDSHEDSLSLSYDEIKGICRAHYCSNRPAI